MSFRHEDSALLLAICARHRENLFSASRDTPSEETLLREDLLYAILRRRRQCWNNRNARRSFMRHMKFAQTHEEDIWFLETLEEHAHIVGCELTSDDTVRMCGKCKDPIRGVVCFNRLHQPLHWGCKQQCRLGEVCSFAIEEKQHMEMTSAQKSKPRWQQTFLRNVET